MTLDFFTPDQGFQKLLNDPSSHVGTKKDYTTNLKRNEFKTSHAKQSGTQQSDKNEKFADMMNALKKKSDAQSKNKTDQAVTDAPDSLSEKDLKMSAFYAEEAALSISTTESEIDTHIDFANIAALNAEIQRLINEQSDETEAEDLVTLTDIQEHISVTDESKPKDIEGVLTLLATFLSDEEDGKLQTPDMTLISILEKIEDSIKSDEALSLTSGLRPEQLADLQEQIQKYLNEELSDHDAKALEALAAQWVSLVPPSKSSEKGSDNTTARTTPAETVMPIQENVIQPLQEKHHTQSRYDTRYDARPDVRVDAAQSDTEGADFKSALENAGVKQGELKTPLTANNDNTQSAGQRFLQLTGFNQITIPAQDLTVSQGSTTAQNIQLPMQSTLTNVITQSPSATQAHPATQLVSATIQKALKAGEDTNIKLRLDPPDLGRVEVKMSIDKDSAAKIVLTAEKPETYMLLKQDAEALERALNNAGLDTESGLEFELANEDHDFHRDHQGQGHSQRSSREDALDEDLIETTMDWHVDPKTGHMHYNLLV